MSIETFIPLPSDPSKRFKSPRPTENKGTFRGLVSDERYRALPWEKKSKALDRFAQANPSPLSEFAKELERLGHFSEDGNVADRKLNSALLKARKRWYKTISDSGESEAADLAFEEDRARALEVYKDEGNKRNQDIRLANQLAKYEVELAPTVGNALKDAVDFFSPGSIAAGLIGVGSEYQNELKIASSQVQTLREVLKKRGYDDDGIEALKRDARLATAGSQQSAAVDSQGNVAINDGDLVRDIDSVRSALMSLDAPDSVKRAKIASLEERQRQVIDGTFGDIVAAGGARWHEDDNGKASAPTLSPKIDIKTLAQETASMLVSPLTGTSSPSRRGEAAGVARSAENFGQDKADELEKEYGWDYEVRKKAVLDLLEKRNDALDRSRIGLSQGLLNDIANMALTPLEMMGADFAKDIAEDNVREKRAFSSADALNEISKKAEYAELAARILPQVILTRKAGKFGKKIASRRTSVVATQNKVATLFATGFGGLQSASFNSRDVLDNGGDAGQALHAGILGFGTTFLVSNGFNKIGLGGVEDFRRRASLGAKIAKSQLMQRLVNAGVGVVGEGIEEFVDEFINGLHTQDFTGASAQELAVNAFKAAVIGGGYGGAFGLVRKTSKPLPSTNDSNESVGQTTDEAMQGMEQAVADSKEQLEQSVKDSLQVVDSRIATLESKEELNEAELKELEDLQEQKKDLLDPNRNVSPDLVSELGKASGLTKKEIGELSDSENLTVTYDSVEDIPMAIRSNAASITNTTVDGEEKVIVSISSIDLKQAEGFSITPPAEPVGDNQEAEESSETELKGEPTKVKDSEAEKESSENVENENVAPVDEVVPSSTKFSPPSEPTIRDRREEPDLPILGNKKSKATRRVVSGGTKESDIIDPTKRKKKFEDIGYKDQGSEVTDSVADRILKAYKNIVSKIGAVYVMGRLGGHLNGGVTISPDLDSNTTSRVLAHELGHATHGAYSEEINESSEIQEEIAKIEENLYPGLRKKVSESDNADVKFFNYLLSPNEIIAEFNVLRFTNPKLAKKIAPKLDAVLKKGESNADVVKKRNATSGFTGSSIPVKRFFTVNRDGIVVRSDKGSSEATSIDYADALGRADRGHVFVVTERILELVEAGKLRQAEIIINRLKKGVENKGKLSPSASRRIKEVEEALDEAMPSELSGVDRSSVNPDTFVNFVTDDNGVPIALDMEGNELSPVEVEKRLKVKQNEEQLSDTLQERLELSLIDNPSNEIKEEIEEAKLKAAESQYLAPIGDDQDVDEDVSEDEEVVEDQDEDSTSTPETPLVNLPYKELKEKAASINAQINLNRTMGFFPALANTRPIALNRSKKDLAEFIEENQGAEKGRGVSLNRTKTDVAEETLGKTEESKEKKSNDTSVNIEPLRKKNTDLIGQATSGKHYGKSGIPKKFFTEKPTQDLLEKLEAWIGIKEEAEISYQDKANVDPNVEDHRREEIELAEELSRSLSDTLQKDSDISEEVAEENPTTAEEAVEKNPDGDRLDVPASRIREIRDGITDSLEDTSSEVLSDIERSRYKALIEKAKTEQELLDIQNEILNIVVEPGLSEEGIIDEDEDVDVDVFLREANAYQKEQYTERFVNGENSADIVRDLRTNGSADLLTDEEIEDQEDSDEGDALVLYSMIFPDPALVLKTARGVWNTTKKSFSEFSKRMIEGFGNRIRPILGRLFSDLKKNDGKVDDSEVIKPIIKPDDDSDVDARLADDKKEAGQVGTSPLNSEEDIETPDTAIPLFSREDAKLLGQDKQSVLNLADAVTGSKPVRAVMEYMTSWLGIPLGNVKLMLQNVKDFSPNIALTANAFSMSTLPSEAKVMRTLLEEKFPDLKVKRDDKGNIEILGVLRKDGGPTPKYFSDLAEDIQRDFEAFDFASDNVRDFFREVVKFNRWAVKMASSEGVVLAEVMNEDGTGIDIGRLSELIYAARGKVTHRDILDNPSTNKDYKNRMAKTGAKGQRKFKTEADGITAGYIYQDHPFDRMIDQIISVKAMVYNQRLFSDSDFRSVALPSKRTVVTEERVDPTSGETIVKRKSFKKGNELLEDVVRLGPLSMRASSADAKQIQNGIDRIHSSSSLITGFADVASAPSKLLLALDLSAMFLQNLYTLFTKPTRWAKITGLSVSNLVGKPERLRKEVAQRADYIKLAVQHGGQWATIAEEFISNRAEADVLERQRDGAQAAGRAAVRPVQRVYTKFGELQGIMQSLAASYTFESDILRLKAEGKFTTENIALAAKSADNIHGRENLSRYGLNSNLVTASRGLLTAAGMYAGFTAVVLDLASPNPQVRKNATRRLGLFAVGVHVSYFALAMAAEMAAEDEDDEDKISRAAKKIGRRMIPGAKDYLTMDVQVGNGTKKLQWGGFYRGLMNAVAGSAAQNLADTMGMENTNIDKTTVDRMGNFLGGKLRSSMHMAEQLISGEDYFGNPATKVEILRNNLVPLSAGPAVVAATDPVLTYLHKTFGISLVNLDRIAVEKPELKLSIFDTISNFVGINGYVEGESAKFNRALNKEAKSQFSKSYDTLTMQEARKVRAGVNQKGVSKPTFKRSMEPIFEMNRKRLKRDLGGVRYNNLNTKTVDSLIARFPFSVVMKKNEETTRVPLNLQNKMRGEIVEGLKKAIDNGITNDALRLKAKDIANESRKANGLPTVR